MAHAISFGDKNSAFQAGVINGAVEFHAPPERPETPPRPSIVIPFDRDADFVERGTTLSRIQQLCAPPGSRAALVGLGGVGKSQLAIEHAYRTRERSHETWVFWVHASNAARFEQSYRDIADCVKIVGRESLRANIFKLVHDWLRNSKEPWLLILDNVDDARFLLHDQTEGQGQPTDDSRTASRPLREYLPRCEHGSILITSRNKDAALKLVEQRNIITVEPMDEAQALVLFETKLGVQDNSGNASKLAAALEYMPLAIAQAAAYISQRSPRCTVTQYLDEFQSSDREKTSLLDYDAAELRRDREAKNSIIVTWHISFDYIRRIRPSAADLLALMSFFDRQGIPEALICDRKVVQEASQLLHGGKARAMGRLRHLFRREERDFKKQENYGNFNSNRSEFEDDLLLLRNYSFLTVTGDGTIFEMHALVQLATRKWLESNGKLEQWRDQFISNLCAAFPAGKYENWEACQALIAHAKSAIGQRPEAESSLVEWAILLYHAACYAESTGNIPDAKEFSLKSMEAQSKVLGQEHEATLWAMGMVALAYKLGGQWDLAENLEAQVVKARVKKLGIDHPHTLMSMSNLASTYRFQGRWEAAEKIDVQVVEASRKMLGADHPDSLSRMDNLAITYGYQGRLEAAEEIGVQVIESKKRKLGVDHLDTIISMSNLALTYSKQGRWEAAEELYMQVIDMYKKKLGADHPTMLISLANLAILYRNQGRWKAAEELLTQVIEIRKKKLGADHPDTLNSMTNLASTYRNQGQLEAAEELESQVLETSKKLLGAGHPHTLNSMGNLASTYRNQGRLEAAEELESQVLETSKKLLGADHPDTLISMGNLALTYRIQGRLEAAEVMFMQGMERSKKKLGADHPNTLTHMANLAFTWKAQGRAIQAIRLMSECVQRQQPVFGFNHPDFILYSKMLAEWEAEYGNNPALCKG